MRNYFLRIFVLFGTLLSFSFAANVSEQLALDVAENFYFSKKDPRNSEFSYRYMYTP